MAIKECHKEHGFPVEAACELIHVARSAYYKWASGKLSHRTAENEKLADKIERIYLENPDKGYRRLNDDLRHDYGIHVNDKRVLRICRARDIRSTIKYNNHGCTRRAKTPQYLAENLLNRQFHAEKPNEKWLTDVTEFKWYEGIEVHKLYLSAILDLCDRRIVSYVLSEHMIIRSSIKPLTKLLRQIQVSIPCPTAIEDTNTQADRSTTNSYRLE